MINITNKSMGLDDNRFKTINNLVIPIDWDLIKLSDVAIKIGSGKTPKGGEKVYLSSGVPFIRSQNVLDNKLNLSDFTHISEKIHEEMLSTKVLSNDVLLNITGASIGRCCIVPNDFKEGNLNQHVCIIRTNQAIDDKLLVYILLSQIGQRQIDINQAGGNREGLNFQQIRNFNIPLPPVKEQKKIVSILSTWDKAIELKEKLVEQKKKQKKGLMHKLLTGEIRVQGFTGEWKEKSLSEFGDFKKGKGIQKKHIKRSGVPCVTYGELYTKHHIYIKRFYSFINESIANNSMEIQKGDLLIAGSGETSTEIGKTVTYLDDQKAFAGGDIIILRPNQKVDSLFISYALNTEQKIKERAELGQGHSVVHIYSSTLSNMKVILPELSEQREIAKRLKTIEETIDLISNKVLELKQQKKGLMQLLLTGQVRTKV